MARVPGTRVTAATHLGVPLDVRLQRVGGGGLLLVGVCQHLPGGTALWRHVLWRHVAGHVPVHSLGGLQRGPHGGQHLLQGRLLALQRRHLVSQPCNNQWKGTCLDKIQFHQFHQRRKGENLL